MKRDELVVVYFELGFKQKEILFLSYSKARDHLEQSYVKVCIKALQTLPQKLQD